MQYQKHKIDQDNGKYDLMVPNLKKFEKIDYEPLSVKQVIALNLKVNVLFVSKKCQKVIAKYSLK